jgi:hypothetical protein
VHAIQAFWQRLKRGPSWAVAAAVTGVLVASCAAPALVHKPGTQSRGGSVIPLTRISALRSVFNRDTGHPRLVLIFSPT